MILMVLCISFSQGLNVTLIALELYNEGIFAFDSFQAQGLHVCTVIMSVQFAWFSPSIYFV